MEDYPLQPPLTEPSKQYFKNYSERIKSQIYYGILFYN